MTCAHCKNITVCAICGKGYAEAVRAGAQVDSMNALRVQAERKAALYRRALVLACDGDEDKVAFYVSEAGTAIDEERAASGVKGGPCPECGRGEVIDGKCDRCGFGVPAPVRPLAALKEAEQRAHGVMGTQGDQQ